MDDLELRYLKANEELAYWKMVAYEDNIRVKEYDKFLIKISEASVLIGKLRIDAFYDKDSGQKRMDMIIQLEDLISDFYSMQTELDGLTLSFKKERNLRLNAEREVRDLKKKIEGIENAWNNLASLDDLDETEKKIVAILEKMEDEQVIMLNELAPNGNVSGLREALSIIIAKGYPYRFANNYLSIGKLTNIISNLPTQ